MASQRVALVRAVGVPWGASIECLRRRLLAESIDRRVAANQAEGKGIELNRFAVGWAVNRFTPAFPAIGFG
jgi:hypothetical protein